MTSLTNTRLAGIDVQHLNNISSLSLMQIGTITSAYLRGDLPLEFNLNIEAKNPNTQPAVLNNFDWIVSIDNIEMAKGTNNNQISIPGNEGTAIIPLKISVNLLDALSGKSKDALLNFGLNLADASNKPSRVDLKIKPTVYINETFPINYPGYITVGTEFGGTSENN